MTPILTGIMCGLVSLVIPLYITQHRQLSSMFGLVKSLTEEIKYLRTRINYLDANYAGIVYWNDIITRPHTPEADQAEV